MNNKYKYFLYTFGGALTAALLLWGFFFEIQTLWTLSDALFYVGITLFLGGGVIVVSNGIKNSPQVRRFKKIFKKNSMDYNTLNKEEVAQLDSFAYNLVFSGLITLLISLLFVYI